MNIPTALLSIESKLKAPVKKKDKPLTVSTSYPTVPLSNIIIDGSIQRAVDIVTVQKIINNFDWSKTKTPICMSDDTNDIYVVDGQHTLMAIAALKKSSKITIQLHKFSGILTPQDREKYGNELFLSCNNGIKKPIDVFYKLRAAKITNDKSACDIFKICEKYSVSLIPKYETPEKLTASNCSQIERAYKTYKKDNFEKAIKFHATQFPEDIIDGSMILALANIYKIYGDKYESDMTRLINSKKYARMSKSPKKTETSIHDISNSDENKVARVYFYNKNDITVPTGWAEKHAWTLGNILLSNGVDIDLTKIVKEK